ncbi:helix-turn-helix domain-containing protein [Pseudalkalibacillus sp. R45]|uniref:helix-turn-helix domain-containing protein n=1 Tax=Pseudalkalibacillus sp. R45 TaxID=3457433 RepID=UPI003FCDFBAF
MILTGKDIHMIREVYRFSCEEFGRRIGVSGSYITMMERGARPVSEEVRRKVKYEFDLTVEKLKSIIDTYNEYSL